MNDENIKRLEPKEMTRFSIDIDTEKNLVIITQFNRLKRRMDVLELSQNEAYRLAQLILDLME